MPRNIENVPRGPAHYKWKGGKPWKRFADPKYQDWRNTVLQRDNYVCQQCFRQCKKSERGLAAHHIKEYAKYPELRYDVSNGITLCRLCHMKLHGRAPKIAEPISCACGCGTLIEPFDKYAKRPRRFLNGHGRRGMKQTEKTKELLRQQRLGKKLTVEHRKKISEGLRNSKKSIGRPKQDVATSEDRGIS